MQMDYHTKIQNSILDLKYPDNISETHTNAFNIDSSTTDYDQTKHNCIQIQSHVKSLGAGNDVVQSIQYSIPSIADYITKFKLNNKVSRVEFVVNGVILNIIFDPKPDTWYDIYPVPVNNLVVPYGMRFLNIEGDARSVDILYLLCNPVLEGKARELGKKFR